MDILWLVSLLTLPFVLTVDRSNFKKCDQSAFCRTVRKQKSSDRIFSVIPESVNILPTSVQMHLRRQGKSGYLLAEVYGLVDNKIRLRIKPFSKQARRRYEIPVGDVLVSQPPESSIHVERRDSNHLVAISESCKLVINLSPFIVDIVCNNDHILSFNSRSLLRFDLGRVKPRGYVQSFTRWLKSFFITEDENNDNAVNYMDDNEELPEDEEKFKTHVDTKPCGFTAIGSDISFPGFNHVYGIPEHADSLLLKSTTSGSDPYRLYNLDVFEYETYNPMALYGSVPYLIAHSVRRTIGVFLHNAAETWVDIHKGSKPSLDTLSRLSDFMDHGDPDKLQTDVHWFSESGVIDLFFFLGPTAADVFRQYAQLTGTTPLPPGFILWALFTGLFIYFVKLFSLAYHQSRWNYNNEQDVADVNAGFDEHDIPMDVIWLDIEHTNGKRYFTWDSHSFPHPDEMVSKISSFGRKMVTIVDPHLRRDSGYFVYSEALSAGHLVLKNDGSVYEGWCWPGSSVWPDFVNPAVRRFWSEKFDFSIYKGSTPDLFTWNDMNEPSVFNGPEITMHKDVVHYGGWEHRDIHNVYGLYVHRATVEGAVWTGDNTGDWDHLRISIPMMLSLNLVGLTFSGADVGGFFRNPDAELLTRWYQAAAFQPFFRTHAHLDTRRREPWLLPAENLAVIRAAIIKRYRLLPYWYWLFFESEKTGAPVMRPLWVEFPTDQSTFSIDSQHLVGSALLVSPVVQKGASFVNVYLPGADLVWYDFDSYQSVNGGGYLNVSVSNLNKIPVFLRGGFILPVRDRIRRSSTLVPDDPYTLIVALDVQGNSKGFLYHDDLHSFQYQTGNYIYREFVFVDGTTLSSRNLNSQADFKTNAWLERVIVVGVKSKPKEIVLSVSDEQPVELAFSYSSKSHVVVIRKPGVNISKDFVIAFS